MKTREQIYGQEASGILRDVTMYRTLAEEQLLHLYPGKEGKVKNLLTHLVRQGRIFFSEDGFYHAVQKYEPPDKGLLAALWVLIDFIDRVEYHSAGDYPAKVIFFADDEVYEVVYAAYGQEALLNHVLSEQGNEPPNYIVIVDKPEQIPQLQIPNVSGFCTVSPSGDVQYFKIE